MNIKETVQDFIKTLNEEYAFLLKTKEFLLEVEHKMTKRELISIDFNNLLGEYELKTEFFLGIKDEMMTKIAESLSIEKSKVSFKLLINMGFADFRILESNLGKLGREIRQLLLKLSVFLKNFSFLNEKEKKINRYIGQKNYTLKVINNGSDGRERNFCWEG